MRSVYVLTFLMLGMSVMNASAQTCNCDRSGMTSAAALYDNTYKAQTSQGTVGSPVTGGSYGSSSGGSSGGGLGGLISGFSGGSLSDMSWTQMAALGSGAVGLYGLATGNKTLTTVGGLGAAGFGLASTDMGKNFLSGDFSQLSMGKVTGMAGIAGSLTGNTTLSSIGSAGEKIVKYNDAGSNMIKAGTSSSGGQTFAANQMASGYDDAAADRYAYNTSNSAEANHLGSAAFESGEGYSAAGNGLGQPISTYASTGDSAMSSNFAPRSLSEQMAFNQANPEAVAAAQKRMEARSITDQVMAESKALDIQREAARDAQIAAARDLIPVSTDPYHAPPDFF
jgi:hypothetical protein